MVRPVRFGAFAILTLGLAGLCGAASAQTVHYDSYVTSNKEFTYWTAERKAKAVDAINRADFSKKEIASILPLLSDLENSERMRKADIAGLENDLIFSRKHIDVDARLSEIDARQYSRVSKIWTAIADRIGPTKMAVLRDTVEGGRIDEMAYYRSDHLARIDTLIAEWDRLANERVAAMERYRAMMQEQVATAPVRTAFPEEAPTVVLTPETAPAVSPAPAVVSQPKARFHRSPVKKGHAKRRVRGLG